MTRWRPVPIEPIPEGIPLGVARALLAAPLAIEAQGVAEGDDRGSGLQRHQMTTFKRLRSTLLVVILVALAGCATAPARSSKMVAVAFSAPAALRGRVTITTVTSPERKTLLQHTNVEADQLREAVKVSLQSAGYLSPGPAAARALLAVALTSLDASGYSTITSRIRYTLTSRASGATFFDEVVEAECTEYAFASWERVQHSTECAIRRNIEAFLQKTLLLQAH
jgi:hypothetical protein